MHFIALGGNALHVYRAPIARQICSGNNLHTVFTVPQLYLQFSFSPLCIARIFIHLMELNSVWLFEQDTEKRKINEQKKNERNSFFLFAVFVFPHISRS